MRARALVLVLTVLGSTSLRGQTPPAIEGPEAAIIKTSCLGCHQLDLIVAQRLSRPAWDRELAKMERWGARLATPDRERVLDYLSGQFGPQAAAIPATSSDAGEAVYRVACRTCHEDDLTRQQRLSAAAWGRTVEKMIRWGAPVSAEQRTPLIAYLAAQWGPLRGPVP